MRLVTAVHVLGSIQGFLVKCKQDLLVSFHKFQKFDH